MAKLQWKTGEMGYIPNPGVREVTITSFEEANTAYGPSLLIHFNDGEGEFGLWYSQRLSPKSNLGQLVMACGFKPKPGEEFDLAQIIGKKIKMLVTKSPNGFPKGQPLGDEVPF